MGKAHAFFLQCCGNRSLASLDQDVGFRVRA
jgi:hypothetical protein